MNVTPISTKDFKWDVSGNFTQIKNKVVSIAPGITVSSLTGQVLYMPEQAALANSQVLLPPL